MLTFIMLSVAFRYSVSYYAEYLYAEYRISNCYAECCYSECRYGECCYAECRGTIVITSSREPLLKGKSQSTWPPCAN